MITYLKGNILELLPTDKSTLKIFPHVANDIPVMGSGIALGIIRKWPTVKEKNKSKTLGENEYIFVRDDVVVVNMVAQHNTIRENPKPIRYKALVECMTKVANYISTLKGFSQNVEIHTIKFGSKRSMGTWSFIEELINEIWCDIPVFIYEYKE